MGGSTPSAGPHRRAGRVVWRVGVLGGHRGDDRADLLTPGAASAQGRGPSRPRLFPAPGRAVHTSRGGPSPACHGASALIRRPRPAEHGPFAHPGCATNLYAPVASCGAATGFDSSADPVGEDTEAPMPRRPQEPDCQFWNGLRTGRSVRIPAGAAPPCSTLLGAVRGRRPRRAAMTRKNKPAAAPRTT